MLGNLLSWIVLAVNWSSITQPFADMGTDLIGQPALMGLIILLFFMLFALTLYIPFEGVVVIMMPTLSLVFVYIPPLKIVVAVLVGLMIGMALIKWVRR